MLFLFNHQVVNVSRQSIFLVKLIGGTFSRKNQNLDMFAGDTRTLRYTITNDDVAGELLDLNDYTIRWWIARKSADTLYKLVSKSSADANQIVRRDLGVFDVFLDPTDTSGLVPALNSMEAEITADDGSQTTVSAGTCLIRLSAKV